MLNFIKPSIFFISILLLSLQGCGESNSSSTYLTTLGDSTAIGTTDANTIIVPNTNIVKSITQEVSTIVKSNISVLNTKTAIAFTKDTNYCEISGLKESQSSGDPKKISSVYSYEHCLETKSIQHGNINIDYTQMDDEGKYPKKIYLTVSEDYSYNNIDLKKNLTIESSIIYNSDQSFKELNIKINGELSLDSINYVLQNITETITY